MAARASAADSETKKRRDPPLRRAQRLQDADLFRALDHHLTEIAGDAKSGDGQDQQSQQKQRGADLQHHVRFGAGDGADGADIGAGELRARARRGRLPRCSPGARISMTLAAS